MATRALDILKAPDLGDIITSIHEISTTHKDGLNLNSLTISDFQVCEFFLLSDSAYASIAPSRDTS